MLHILAELGFGVAGLASLGITAGMMLGNADKILAALGIARAEAPRACARPVRVRVSARRSPGFPQPAPASLRAAA